jgi:nucleotide-binding universal stress UspA family protein
MKTLLSLVDNPADPDGFILYSFEFARDYEMNLHFIYIQNPILRTLDSGSAVDLMQPVGDELDITRVEKERKNALIELDKTIQEMRKNHFPEVTAGLGSETGAMDQVVNRFAANNRADMILIKGSSANGMGILDSTNAEMLVQIRCPGLLIPAGMDYRLFRKIVYATDYNPGDIDILSDLIDFAGKYSPEIIALHLTGSDEKVEQLESPGFKDAVIRQTGYEKISIELIRIEKGKNHGESINDFAGRVNADLVVLLKENKKFLQKIFESGITRKTLRKAQLPVLVYHEK